MEKTLEFSSVVLPKPFTYYYTIFVPLETQKTEKYLIISTAWKNRAPINTVSDCLTS